MKNEELINTLTVMRDVLKAAKLAYDPAELMIKSLTKYPVYTIEDLERAFAAGFLSNMKSMDDFKGNSLINKFEAYKNSGYFKFDEIKEPNHNI